MCEQVPNDDLLQISHGVNVTTLQRKYIALLQTTLSAR